MMRNSADSREAAKLYCASAAGLRCALVVASQMRCSAETARRSVTRRSHASAEGTSGVPAASSAVCAAPWSDANSKDAAALRAEFTPTDAAGHGRASSASRRAADEACATTTADGVAEADDAEAGALGRSVCIISMLVDETGFGATGVGAVAGAGGGANAGTAAIAGTGADASASAGAGAGVGARADASTVASIGAGEDMATSDAFSDLPSVAADAASAVAASAAATAAAAVAAWRSRSCSSRFAALAAAFSAALAEAFSNAAAAAAAAAADAAAAAAAAAAACSHSASAL